MTESAKGRTTLLIIDDDRAIRRLLARIAERAGFAVDTAKDGVQALEMMEMKAYDIAIVDLMMPRLSGYEVLEKIGTLTPRPVVLVATALMNGDLANIDDSMVRRVIRKPFDINAVAAALIESGREIARKQAEGQAVVPMTGQAAVIPEGPKIITSDPAVPERESSAHETSAEAKPLPPTEKIE